MWFWQTLLCKLNMQYFKFTVARQLYTAFTCFTDSKYRVSPDLPLENLKKFTFVNKEKIIDDCKVAENILKSPTLQLQSCLNKNQEEVAKNENELRGNIVTFVNPTPKEAPEEKYVIDDLPNIKALINKKQENQIVVQDRTEKWLDLHNTYRKPNKLNLFPVGEDSSKKRKKPSTKSDEPDNVPPLRNVPEIRELFKEITSKNSKHKKGKFKLSASADDDEDCTTVPEDQAEEIKPPEEPEAKPEKKEPDVDNIVKIPTEPVGPGAHKDGEYKNPEYFSYNNMSFFDALTELSKFRQPQPSNKTPIKEK
ncbi:uncharacterized protein LOC109597671 [Aethina tumida]|uniref:uncharacterized protein LOC109597671 n=1 Tax=Aethina tumida TaxID=116153 RepID=UPI00096AF8DD|nr:uncharacterized protein LOC109597671 [Aethina tumida]